VIVPDTLYTYLDNHRTIIRPSSDDLRTCNLIIYCFHHLPKHNASWMKNVDCWAAILVRACINHITVYIEHIGHIGSVHLTGCSIHDLPATGQSIAGWIQRSDTETGLNHSVHSNNKTHPEACPDARSNNAKA